MKNNPEFALLSPFVPRYNGFVTGPWPVRQQGFLENHLQLTNDSKTHCSDVTIQKITKDEKCFSFVNYFKCTIKTRTNNSIFCLIKRRVLWYLRICGVKNTDGTTWHRHRLNSGLGTLRSKFKFIIQEPVWANIWRVNICGNADGMLHQHLCISVILTASCLYSSISEVLTWFCSFGPTCAGVCTEAESDCERAFRQYTLYTRILARTVTRPLPLQL